MLADKNEEIDHLKEQLSKKEKQLEMYSSLNLDETQLRELARQTEAKNSARTLSDILSIHSECEETAEAIRGINTTQNLPNVSTFKVPFTLKNIDDSIVPLMDSAKMIHPQVPPLDLGSQSLSAISSQQSGMLDLLHSGLELKTSSSENNLSNDKTDHVTQSRQVQKSPEKHIDEKNDSNKSCVTSIKYTQTSINEALNEMEKLENQLQIMKEELNTKSAILNKKENDLITLQKHYDELQTEFKEVIETLSRDKYFYQNQYELSRVSENKIKKDIPLHSARKLRDYLEYRFTTFDKDVRFVMHYDLDLLLFSSFYFLFLQVL